MDSGQRNSGRCWRRTASSRRWRRTARLSAMLVAEAGFDAIWASGFELSAMYGVPDVSVVSMTQHLDMTRAMVERSGLPVVADIDTGFGNAINVLYVIEQYERAGVGRDRHGGQELPQGHQPDRRRPPGHGPHRGIPGQDRSGARGAQGQGPRARGAHRGADRGPRPGRGAEAGARLRGGRRRHDPGPFQAEDARRDRGLREGLGRQGADRAGADRLSADDGGAGARAQEDRPADLGQPRRSAPRSAPCARPSPRSARTAASTASKRSIATVEDVFDLQGMGKVKDDEKRFLR